MSTMKVTNLKHESSSVNNIVLNSDGSVGGELATTLASKADYPSGGSDGQALIKSGTTTAWGSAGGGKVLQVVANSTATWATSSSSTYADTNLTASITPSSTGSQVLVIVQQCGVRKRDSSTYVGLRLLRGATNLGTFGVASGFTFSNAINDIGTVGCVILDTPATTSATTYKTQFNSGANSSEVSVQTSGELSTIVLMEIGA